ncbi:MAG: hypothetical protein J6F30_00625 [Cellulosilyticum sp.]|nr:hypothetical protein [Cellulosilyticum sp.]
MKKRMLLAILCVGILIASGITAYKYFEDEESPDYANEMFVDRGDIDGYGAMYDLYTTL